MRVYDSEMSMRWNNEAWSMAEISVLIKPILGEYRLTKNIEPWEKWVFNFLRQGEVER